MRKVNLDVIRPWIAKKVVELVGLEDEVVVEYAMGLLEDKQQPVRLLICYMIDMQVLITFMTVESRPKKDANKLDRLPHKRHSIIYGCALGSSP